MRRFLPYRFLCFRISASIFFAAFSVRRLGTKFARCFFRLFIGQISPKALRGGRTQTGSAEIPQPSADIPLSRRRKRFSAHGGKVRPKTPVFQTLIVYPRAFAATIE